MCNQVCASLLRQDHLVPALRSLLRECVDSKNAEYKMLLSCCVAACAG